MADDVGTVEQTAVVEASPVEGESPPSDGLGANDRPQEQEPDRQARAYAQLKSRHDRLEEMLRRSTAEAERTQRMLANAAAQANYDKLMEEAPDPIADPLGYARAARIAHYRSIEQATEAENERLRQQQMSIESQRRQERVQRETALEIQSFLADLEKRTGVRIEPNDERLVRFAGGNEARVAFQQSAELAAREAVALRRLQEAEARVKDAGIDRFDGGGASAGAVEGPMSFERWSTMSWAERQDWRKNKPDQVRAMEQRMASGRSA